MISAKILLDRWDVSRFLGINDMHEVFAEKNDQIQNEERKLVQLAC